MAEELRQPPIKKRRLSSENGNTNRCERTKEDESLQHKRKDRPTAPNQKEEQSDDFTNKKVTAITCIALIKDLTELIKEKQCAPILVRLAWHDAGTFCASTNTGGSRAAQRFEKGESEHAANAGLQIARNLLKTIELKYCNAEHNVSICDLWALAGTTAIFVCGGPDIPFKFGRKDCKNASESVEDGRLPDATKGLDHLRCVFHRMGLTDKDIVCLSGAHTLGSCHLDRSGFDGPWTDNAFKFDNSYFKDLCNKKWKECTNSKGNVQLKNANDEKDNTMMLVSDYALFADNKEIQEMVKEYATNEKLFFKDFADSWTKLIDGVACKDNKLYSPIMNEDNMVWIDCEMTGLDKKIHCICEIAVIITDKDLNIIAESPDLVIHLEQKHMDDMSDWCVEHFSKSGLLGEINESKIGMMEAQDIILQFIKKYVPNKKGILCGNSVHADRAFLEKDMNKITDYLHYRIVDVSSVKVLCSRWAPEIFEKAPKKANCHRALADIRESLKELKYYRQFMFNS